MSEEIELSSIGESGGAIMTAEEPLEPAYIPKDIAIGLKEGTIYREDQPVLIHRTVKHRGPNVEGRKWVNGIFAVSVMEAAIFVSLIVLWAVTFGVITTQALISLSQVMIVGTVPVGLIVIPLQYGKAWEQNKETQAGRQLIIVYIVAEILNALGCVAGIIYRVVLIETCGTSGHDSCNVGFALRAEYVFLVVAALGTVAAILGFTFAVLLFLKLGFGRPEKQLYFRYHYTQEEKERHPGEDKYKHPLYVPADAGMPPRPAFDPNESPFATAPMVVGGSNGVRYRGPQSEANQPFPTTTLG